jgi:hypothetical protein
MMKVIRMASGTVVLVLGMVLAAAPALAAEEVEAHSGILTAIDPAHHTLTLSEMGPWRGPVTARTTRSIAITPGTGIELVRRSTNPAAGGWPGGYDESPLTPAQLHPGDFATVKVAGQGRQATAVSIEVVRPSRG